MSARAPRRLAAVILLALSVLAVDTSCTAKPDCHQWPGTHAQRMPSHQHYLWTCSPGGGAS